MPLSSKLHAEYVELINQALDAIPMLKPTDFRTAVIDLEKILASTSEEDRFDFDSQLKEHMETVHEFYMQPELYVEARADDAEYQQIIRDRIQAKIVEFNSFTSAQKHQYVTDQKAVRDQAARHQSVMAEGESRRAQNASTMEAQRAEFPAYPVVTQCQIHDQF